MSRIETGKGCIYSLLLGDMKVIRDGVTVFERRKRWDRQCANWHLSTSSESTAVWVYSLFGLFHRQMNHHCDYPDSPSRCSQACLLVVPWPRLPSSNKVFSTWSLQTRKLIVVSQRYQLHRWDFFQYNPLKERQPSGLPELLLLLFPHAHSVKH